MNENEQIFYNHISNFYRYMVTMGNITPKTSRDYITRLRFLAKRYRLDENLTLNSIQEILDKEKILMQHRNEYNAKHTIGDFSAGLKKFLAFVQCDYNQVMDNIILNEKEKVFASSLQETEKAEIVKSRRGQGLFREKLIAYWKGCSVTHYQKYTMLVASHIKPWYVSDNESRLNVYNGLLLTPNLDKLFDLGYITFDTKGDIVLSHNLEKDDIDNMHISCNMRLTKLTNQHIPFLKYHNDNCFLG